MFFRLVTFCPLLQQSDASFGATRDRENAKSRWENASSSSPHLPSSFLLTVSRTFPADAACASNHICHQMRLEKNLPWAIKIARIFALPYPWVDTTKPRDYEYVKAYDKWSKG